ncbi:hypothetical protein [Streptomyces sp. NBC_00829]|uniref:hypothetical protein n=1 Tax=Streptomyces sp. NBC_00829 TaxID=2903679 RepID=UPI00386D5001|nr:hypothetical protein OG293_31545 [Streptomyces sp. NBC_00829]
MAAYVEDIVTADAELFDSLAIPEDELENLLRQVDPETLPGAINEGQAPVLHLPDEGDESLGGGGLSPDDEGRARLANCPSCGHMFTPGR